MKKLILTAIALMYTILLCAQIPQAFKYQAVIRNNQGKILVNQVVSLRISILQDNPLGNMVYVETHQTATNDYGIANISIGGGTVVTGIFADIAWGTTTHFVKTELDITGNQNYEFIGTSQLLSVPYALYAEKAGNVSDDLDKDPTNEIQALSFTNDTLYLSNGGKVFLGNYFDNTDNQNLTINGSTLSISGGNSVTFAGAVDLDADPLNELQVLSYVNDTIFLSKGNYIVLPHNWDNDTLNEIQQISILKDTIKLSKGGEIILPDNSIQFLSLSEIQNIVPYKGLVVFNTDYKMLQIFDGYQWNGNQNTTCVPYPNNPIAGEDIISDTIAIELNGNQPYIGVKGFWKIIYGNGGSFIDSTLYNTVFIGEHFSKYILQWNLYTECDTLHDEINILISGILKDIDNNIYLTKDYGNQFWMIENLKTTKYNNGQNIPNITNASTWESLTNGAYCVYDNTPSNSLIYGNLYNRAAVNNGLLCPEGWRVANEQDWLELVDYLTNANYGYEGNGDDIGKAVASTDWTLTSTIEGEVGNNSSSNNTSGFNIKPSGSRGGIGGQFVSIGYSTGFWTPNTDNIVILRYNYNTLIFGMPSDNNKGYSVRCIKE